MAGSDNQGTTYTNGEMTIASWMTLVSLVRSLDPQTQERFRVEIAKSLEQFLDPLNWGTHQKQERSLTYQRFASCCACTL